MTESLSRLGRMTGPGQPILCAAAAVRMAAGHRRLWRDAVRIVLGLAFLLLLAGTAGAERRVALVIGNAEYRLEPLKLANPGNDATAVAKKLRNLDFDVTVHTDLGQEQMAAALREFSAAAENADMAVFFFAGHGIQKDGENYLLGLNFTELSLAALSESSLSLSEVQSAMTSAKPRIGVVIIDACRNNPFAEQGIVTPGLARASGGAGLLFAYSTDPGNVAYDGDGDHSQFTAALVRHMDAPGLDLRLMFGRVRQNVILDTGGLQIPWVEESVIGEHSFSKLPPQPPESAVAREIERWREISGLPGREPYEQFLAEFPDGIFRKFAEERIRTPLENLTADAAYTDALSDENRPVVAAALSVLGFLPPLSDGDVPREATLHRALKAYELQSGVRGVDPERLYVDASRTLALLGAKTAQQIRTDMALLRAVETAAEMAETAMGELEELVESNPDAQPILLQARADMKSIRDRRDELLEQLDAGREYYTELIGAAAGKFEPLIRGIAADMTKEVRATERLRGRHGSDIELFVRHVSSQQDAQAQGSYAWMVDFLPE